MALTAKDLCGHGHGVVTSAGVQKPIWKERHRYPSATSWVTVEVGLGIWWRKSHHLPQGAGQGQPVLHLPVPLRTGIPSLKVLPGPGSRSQGAGRANQPRCPSCLPRRIPAARTQHRRHLWKHERKGFGRPGADKLTGMIQSHWLFVTGCLHSGHLKTRRHEEMEQGRGHTPPGCSRPREGLWCPHGCLLKWTFRGHQTGDSGDRRPITLSL